MLWKIGFLEKDIRDYAILKLAYKIEDEILLKRLIRLVENSDKDFQEQVKSILDLKQTKG